MKVAKGLLVRCEVELRVHEGEVIESSRRSGPIAFVHGAGKMLAALEARLDGMDVGEERRGVLAAAEIAKTLPTLAVPRSLFPANAKLEPGSLFQAKDPQGRPLELEVLTVDANEVRARAVHPLAGKDLAYHVKVLSVQKPPPPVPRKVAELDAEELVEDATAT